MVEFTKADITEGGVYTTAIEGGYSLLSRASPVKVWGVLERLQANQWLEADELAELKWQKLKSLLLYTFENVPFYRELWKAHGVDPRKFRELSDMKHLPVVGKPELIKAQNEEGFLLSRRNDYQYVQTSGTTGARFRVPFTFHDFVKKYAGYLREYYATDWRLGKKSAALHYSGHPEFGGRFDGNEIRDSHSLVRRLAFGIAHRRIVLHPYSDGQSGNDQFARDWYERLSRYQPYLLETMDFNLLALDDFIARNELKPLSIPRMFVLGTLGSGLKERLEGSFNTEIFDRYGPHEVEGIAYACHVHDGMHIAADTVHVEVLDDSHNPLAPDETGSIVLTDMDSRLLPLIRYRIGDEGRLFDRPCTCGRGFPLMSELDGRTRDVYVMRSGKKVPPADIASKLQDIESIALFQVIHEGANGVTARVVPRNQSGFDAIAERVKSQLEKLLGGNETIAIELVDKLELESNGKFCFVKNVAG